MKRLTAILAAALFLFPAVLGYAADVNAPAAGVQKAVKKTARTKTVTGEVTALDLAAKTFSVKGRKGEVRLVATEKTRGIALDKLKTGDKVAVRYSVTDGKNIAISIKAPRVKEPVKKAAAAEQQAAPQTAPAAPAKPAKPAQPITGC